MDNNPFGNFDINRLISGGFKPAAPVARARPTAATMARSAPVPTRPAPAPSFRSGGVSFGAEQKTSNPLSMFRPSAPKSPVSIPALPHINPLSTISQSSLKSLPQMSPITRGPGDWASYITARAPAYGLDPQAALSVARVEGLSGLVGDSGHAFGPFQMNNAGGVLSGRFNSPAEAKAYSESAAGIDEALRTMAASGAKGLTGPAAVNAIVRRFERPAAPNAEVARALAGYSASTPAGYNGAAGTYTSAPNTVAQAPSPPPSPQTRSGFFNGVGPKAISAPSLHPSLLSRVGSDIGNAIFPKANAIGLPQNAPKSSFASGLSKFAQGGSRLPKPVIPPPTSSTALPKINVPSPAPSDSTSSTVSTDIPVAPAGPNSLQQDLYNAIGAVPSSELNGMPGIGSDGYANPKAYGVIKRDYISKGGTAAGFDKLTAKLRNPDQVAINSAAQHYTPSASVIPPTPPNPVDVVEPQLKQYQQSKGINNPQALLDLQAKRMAGQISEADFIKQFAAASKGAKGTTNNPDNYKATPLNFLKALPGNAVNMAQQGSRFVPELGASIEQAVTHKPTTLNPNTFKPATLMFGHTPIQSIQEKAKGAQASHPGGFQAGPLHLSPGQTGLAEGALSLAQDVPVVAGLGKIIGKAAKGAIEGGITAAGKNAAVNDLIKNTGVNKLVNTPTPLGELAAGNTVKRLTAGYKGLPQGRPVGSKVLEAPSSGLLLPSAKAELSNSPKTEAPLTISPEGGLLPKTKATTKQLSPPPTSLEPIESSLSTSVLQKPTVVKTNAKGIQTLTRTGRLPTNTITKNGDHTITINQDLSAYKDHIPAGEITNISKSATVSNPSLISKISKTPLNEGGYIKIPGLSKKSVEPATTTPELGKTGSSANSVALSDVLSQAKTNESKLADRNVVIDALGGKTGIIAQRAKQEEIYKSERSQRLAQSQAQGANLPGLAGHQAEMGALKGELTKKPYNGMGDHLTPTQQDDLFTRLRQQVKDNSKITGYQEINTNEAVRKIIYGDDRPPQTGEIKLLQKAFGGDFSNAVINSVKSNLGEKAFALWRSGLLTGPKTVTKIITSHAVQLPAEGSGLITDAPIDKAISLFTNQRSKVAGFKGGGGGYMGGVKSGIKFFKTGVDTQQGHIEDFTGTRTFGTGPVGKVLEAYSQIPGRLHGSIYQPFHGFGYGTSLYNQAKVAAINQGIKGAERKTFIENFVKNPTPEVMKIARESGQRYAFQQETALNKLITGAQKALENSKMPGANLLLKTLVPFKRIPSAIISGAMDYSPAGGIHSIVKAVGAAKSSGGLTVDAQRQLVEGLGRSIRGTAVVVPGAILYNKGIMTLNYPSDSKTQELWTEQGKHPDSVLVNGKWRSLGSLGPLGIVLLMGGHFAKGLKDGQGLPGAFASGYAGGVKAILSQSYVQGLSTAASAAQDPGRYLPNLKKQFAGSVVPTGVAQVASAGDKNVRQINTPTETIKSRIPGIRQSLSVKTDSLGKPIPNEHGIGAILDPFYSTKAQSGTPLTKELDRLNQASAGVGQPKIATKENFNSIKTVLTKPQAIQLQQSIGQNIDSLWSQAITNSQYQNLSDDGKHTVLADISAQVTAYQKNQFAKANQLGQYNSNYVGKKTKAPLLPSVSKEIQKAIKSERTEPYLKSPGGLGFLSSPARVGV